MVDTTSMTTEEVQRRAGDAILNGSNVPSGATDSGNPVKVGGVYNSTLPTFTTGQRGDMQIGSRGSLHTELWSSDSVSPIYSGTPADGDSNARNSIFVVARPEMYNGSTWDAARNAAGAAASPTLVQAVSKTGQSVTDCVISSGQTVSAAVDLGVFRLVGISTPAALTGTTFTFQASYDNSTWNTVYDTSGTAKSITVAASRRIILSPADFWGIRYIKVVSGSAEGADRTLKLIAEA